MSWKDKIKEFGGGDLTFLSEDGEALKFIVVGEPILFVGKFKGRPTERIGCPIVTEDGFVLFITGKRLARKISKYEEQFDNTCFIAVRRGGQNDINTTYELSILEDDAYRKKLFEIKNNEFSQQLIDEAVEAAKEMMTV